MIYEKHTDKERTSLFYEVGTPIALIEGLVLALGLCITSAIDLLIVLALFIDNKVDIFKDVSLSRKLIERVFERK